MELGRTGGNPTPVQGRQMGIAALGLGDHPQWPPDPPPHQPAVWTRLSLSFSAGAIILSPWSQAEFLAWVKKCERRCLLLDIVPAKYIPSRTWVLEGGGSLCGKEVEGPRGLPAGAWPRPECWVPSCLAG